MPQNCDPDTTLLLYYSQTGRTRAVSENLAHFSRLFQTVPLKKIGWHSDFCARTLGYLDLRSHRDWRLYPIAEDVSAYSTLVLLCPVWYRQPCPAITSFLHQYDVEGKVIHCLLTFDGEVGHADQMVKDAIRGAGGIVGSTALLKLTEKTLQSIRDASLELFLDREKGLSVRRGKER